MSKNLNSSLNKGMSKKEPRIWNGTEEALLKKWGEQAASYRILHNRSYRKYKYLTALFTIPVIIISTLTGTANFSQGTIIQIYPSFDVYLPLMIGALNLISGIITTIGQFLRVSELNEAHRNSSISYGKFARNISTELSLPPNERTYSGLDFIQICRNEMDRLIEQSPEIGMAIISKFENNKKFKNIVKPEVINISSIVPYQPTKDEKIQDTISNAAGKFRNNFLKNKLIEDNSANSQIREKNLELSDLKKNNIVKNFGNTDEINKILQQHNYLKKDENGATSFDTAKFQDQIVNPLMKSPIVNKKVKTMQELISEDNLNKIKNMQSKDDDEESSPGVQNNIFKKLDTIKNLKNKNFSEMQNELKTELNNKVNQEIEKEKNKILQVQEQVQNQVQQQVQQTQQQVQNQVQNQVQQVQNQVQEQVQEQVQQTQQQVQNQVQQVQEQVQEQIKETQENIEEAQELSKQNTINQSTLLQKEIEENLKESVNESINESVNESINESVNENNEEQNEEQIMINIEKLKKVSQIITDDQNNDVEETNDIIDNKIETETIEELDDNINNV